VLATVVWKDEQDVKILINMHKPPAQGNFVTNRRKLAIVTDYNQQMGYNDRTEWLIAIKLVGEHDCGQKHPAIAKLTTGNFIWFWFRICWN
jgi:hypothetical protein